MGARLGAGSGRFSDCVDRCDREGVQRGALGHSVGRSDGAQADERDRLEASLWGCGETVGLTNRGDFGEAKGRAEKAPALLGRLYGPEPRRSS